MVQKMNPESSLYYIYIYISTGADFFFRRVVAAPEWSPGFFFFATGAGAGRWWKREKFASQGKLFEFASAKRNVPKTALPEHEEASLMGL